MRAVWITPSPSEIAHALTEFTGEPHGTVTAYEDAALPYLHRRIPLSTAIEARTFTDLARRVARACGLEPSQIASGAVYDAAVARACAGDPSPHPLINRSLRHASMHRRVGDVLQDLRAWGIPLADLEWAAGLSPATVEKLRLLQAIDRDLTESLRALNFDQHSAHLAAVLGEVPDLDGESDRLWVLVGDTVHPRRSRWLQWADSNGFDVTVVLFRAAHDGDLFSGARETAEQLGISVAPPTYGAPIALRLYAPNPGPDPSSLAESGPSLQLVQAPDPMSECEWLVSHVRDLPTYASRAIYVRDADLYFPLLAIAADQLGVELAIPRREPLLNNAAARLTLRLLDAYCSPDPRTLEFLTNIACGGWTRDGRNRAQQIFGEAVLSPDPWATVATTIAGETQMPEWLGPLLGERETARSMDRSPADWHAWLRDFFERLPWHQTLKERDAANQSVDHATEFDLVAFPAMLRALAGYASVDRATRESALSLADFSRLLRQLWEGSTIHYPRPTTGVPVTGNINTLPPCTHLFIPGLVEGHFPRRRREDPVLNDLERDEINAAGAGLAPLATSLEAVRKERDLLYRLAISPTTSLYVSYPATNGDSDGIPSFMLTTLRELGMPTEAHVYGLNDSARAVTPVPPDPDAHHAQPDTCAALAEPDRRSATIPALVDAMTCPFRYQFTHRIRLPKTRSGAAWWSLGAIPAETAVHHMGNPVAERQALEAGLDAHLRQLTPTTAPWELDLIRFSAQGVIQDFVRRSELAQELWPRERTRVNVAYGTASFRDWSIGIEGTAAAVSEVDGRILITRYRSHLSEPTGLSDRLFMEIGLMICAMRGESRGMPLVELDGLTGRRALFHMPGELPTYYGGPKKKEGIYRIELAPAEPTHGDAQPPSPDKLRAESRAVAVRLAEMTRSALDVMRTGDLTVRRNEQCERCRLRALCRLEEDPLDAEGDDA
jgi:hypothetical protein